MKTNGYNSDTHHPSARHTDIHQRALIRAQNYRASEIELIEALEEVDGHRVFYQYGYSSLFTYTTEALGLSPEVAYIFINVCRKTREVPALKEEIKSGAITVSKAKKLTPVLTSQIRSTGSNWPKPRRREI